MGLDMSGKWQKKINGEWIDIEGRFEWFQGNRNREFFWLLMGERNEATKEIEKELIVVLSKMYSSEKTCDKILSFNSIKELNDAGWNFDGAGFLSLKELKEIRKTLKKGCAEARCLDSFIGEVEKYVETDDEDYRAIFVFDN